MEPIHPEFPWQNSWQVICSPEEKLIHAILIKAWEDANSPRPTLKKINAQAWFFSPTFNYYCELTKLSPTPIQDYANKKWRIK